MGRKDLSEKAFFDNAINFSEICNGILFHGEERIRPQELESTTTEYLYLDKKTSSQRYVDVAKKWKGREVELAIIAMEGQSEVDYRMVFRNMLSEALNYNHQWKQKQEKQKKGKNLTEAEFLSGLSKEDKFVPVITIVLYLGEEEWDAATDLYAMLDLNEELKPYISNYQLNLFDYHKYDSFDFFHGEVKVLFEVLSCMNDKNKMYEVLKANGPIECDTAILLGELINVKGFEEYSILSNDGRERVNMCKAFEDFKEEGRQEGREEARKETIETLKMTIEMCKELGGSIQLITKKLSETFSISEEEARQKIEVYW